MAAHRQRKRQRLLSQAQEQAQQLEEQQQAQPCQQARQCQQAVAEEHLLGMGSNLELGQGWDWGWEESALPGLSGTE